MYNAVVIKFESGANQRNSPTELTLSHSPLTMDMIKAYRKLSYGLSGKTAGPRVGREASEGGENNIKKVEMRL